MPSTGVHKWLLLAGLSTAAGLIGWLGGRLWQTAWQRAQPPEPPISSLPLMRVHTFLFRPASVGIQAQRSLVLILEPSCQFCVQSASFHRDLLRAAQQHGFQRVLVFPDADGESRSYPARHSLSADTLKTYRDLLRRPAGVPAVVFLDSRSAIDSFWYGALSPEEAREVLAAVQNRRPPARRRRLPSGELLLSSDQVRTLSRDDPAIRVISLEERSTFGADRWPGATLIPLPELEMRIFSEMQVKAKVILDCSPLNDWTCELTLRKLQRRGIRVFAADLSL